MKIIAVMNQKGGVGKTMTAASIAYILGEEYNKKVLVADADQQGNISMLYGRFEPEGRGMSELLEKHEASGGTYSTGDLIQTTPYKNIDIITANGYLMRTNMQLLLMEQGDQILRFAAAMNEVRTVYDYCIVDCGLLMDMTVANVMAAADLVIVPVKVGGFEVEAADNMEEQLEEMRAFNPDIKMRVLITMRQNNKTSVETEGWMKNHSGHDCYATVVRRSIIAEKSTAAKVPLPNFSKNCIVTEDYRNVVSEIIRGDDL
nr:MAG TPA: ParA [Caudoviricetes sp.]